MSIRFVSCETCQGEGRLITMGIVYEPGCGHGHRGEVDRGPCPECHGACVVETDAEPRTLDDLEQEDFDEGISPALDDGRCPCGFDEPKCTAYRDQCLYAGEGL